MFPKKSQTDLNKNVFLHNLDEAREARRREKQMQQATIIIQKTVRGYLVRKKYRDYRKNELNQLFLGFTDPNPQKYPSLQLASTMFTHLQHFLLYYNRMKVKSNSIDLQQLLLGFINYSSTSLIADDIKVCTQIEITLLIFSYLFSTVTWLDFLIETLMHNG
ncbi:unnamed protein product [Rotaria magnacalcarata]|uniref:Uncharacterized protein n=1 Tax=Rotaria magnacalcarata TaxID=392030 RepID=A0A8S3EZ79_9BILA|nr:unnamed protein product [Rotaria magnacalcarata]CAF5186995.1 unnamed protein product [Rotaria magnacalcarata]